MTEMTLDVSPHNRKFLPSLGWQTQLTGVLVLFIISLLCIHSICSSELYAQAPIIPSVSTIMADTPPAKFTITPAEPRLHQFDGKWEINYEHSLPLRFIPSADSDYFFHVISEYAKISFAVTDSNHVILVVGSELEQRHHKRTAKVALHSGSSYFIIIGTATINSSVAFRVWVTRDSSACIPADADRVVTSIRQSSIYKGTLTSNSQMFEMHWADYFRVALPDDSKDWIKIRVRSPDFDPLLLALDKNDHVADFNYGIGKNTRDATLTLSPENSRSTLVVVPDNQEKLVKSHGAGSYSLSLERFPYNPQRGIAGWMEYQFGNPIVNFLCATILGIAISYFFFWKAFRVKSISFEILTDRLLIDDRNTDAVTLCIGDTKEPIKCASYFRVKLWHSGHARIPSDYVRQPLQLILGNVDKVLHIRDELRTGGWYKTSIDKNNPRSINVAFSTLDPGDRLIISCICEQRQPDDIVPTLSGNVSETTIQRKRGLVSHTIGWLVVIFDLFFVILGPILILDIKYNFMPTWFPTLFLYLWLPAVGLIYIFFLLTRRGRRVFRSMVSSIFHDHPLRLLAPSQTQKEDVIVAKAKPEDLLRQSAPSDSKNNVATSGTTEQ